MKFRSTITFYGGATFRAPIGGILKGRNPTSADGKSCPWCMWRGTMLSLIVNGPTSDCRLRRNGNTPRAADSIASPMSGVKTKNRVENGTQIFGRGDFPLRIRPKTALELLLPLRAFRRMVSVYTTW